MGAKDSILEFAREPAGGGYDRAWCFPLQCVVVARLPRVGNAAHAAFGMLPTPVLVLAGLAERADGALSPGGVTFQYPPPVG